MFGMPCGTSRTASYAEQSLTKDTVQGSSFLRALLGAHQPTPNPSKEGKCACGGERRAQHAKRKREKQTLVQSP